MDIYLRAYMHIEVLWILKRESCYLVVLWKNKFNDYEWTRVELCGWRDDGGGEERESTIFLRVKKTQIVLLCLASCRYIKKKKGRYMKTNKQKNKKRVYLHAL